MPFRLEIGPAADVIGASEEVHRVAYGYREVNCGDDDIRWSLLPPERDRPWVMRTYAGHSSAAASNALFRRNLAKGQTGLSVAFDLPTQTGYDPDHELARGEVGRRDRLVAGYPPRHDGPRRTGRFRSIFFSPRCHAMPFRRSGILWPRCLPALLVRGRTFRALSSGRPGAGRSADVGDCHVRLSSPGAGRDGEATVARTKPGRRGRSSLMAHLFHFRESARTRPSLLATVRSARFGFLDAHKA